MRAVTAGVTDPSSSSRQHLSLLLRLKLNSAVLLVVVTDMAASAKKTPLISEGDATAHNRPVEIYLKIYKYCKYKLSYIISRPDGEQM